MRKTLKFLMLLVSISLLLSPNTSSFATDSSKHVKTQNISTKNYIFAQSNLRSCESHCRFAYRSCLRNCTNSPMKSACITMCEMGYENCLTNCYRTYSQQL